MAVEAAPPSNGPVDRWNRFWFATGSALSLGIFRALFAICLLAELPSTREKSLFAIEGGFHLPYLPLVGLVSPSIYTGIHSLQVPLIVLLGLGVLPRVSAGVLLGLQGYVFFADQLNFRNHPYFFQLILLLLVFSPAGQSFSLPSLLRRRSARRGQGASEVGAVAPLTVQRLLQFQVSVVYFYSALHKMTEQYLDGHVLVLALAPEVLHGRLGVLLRFLLPVGVMHGLQASAVRPEFWVFAAWGTVLLEISLPFALWIPRVRGGAMFLGVAFHLAIAFSMRIEVFSAAMIATYLLFLDPDTVPAIERRMREHLFGRPAQSERKARRSKREAG